MLYLIVAVLVLVVVAVAVPLLRKPNRLDEVDRFHTARSLTTSWSAGPAAQVPDAGQEGEAGRD